MAKKKQKTLNEYRKMSPEKLALRARALDALLADCPLGEIPDLDDATVALVQEAVKE